MASKDSAELGTNERYPLGDYSFRIERTSVPGSSNDKIEAICTKGGKNARKSIQVPSSTKIEGWYVEANETEATVYVIVEANPTATLKSGSPSAVSGQAFASINDRTYVSTNAQRPVLAGTIKWSNNWADPLLMDCISDVNNNITQTIRTYTVDGVVFYANTGGGYANGVINSGAFLGTFFETKDLIENLARTYFDFHYDAENKMVGRFAIDIEDAGGDGPGSDWVDPGDYDPDWEEGDPTHTLYVEVTGALSGRHNDPIVDPSYSYIPSDKDTVKDYGCGGDGGHGGGGGAGASTVVIHKFATNQANSKEVTTLARRHGYGSGGGKGGKGGDGCILIYY